jgi:hypothetical protein
MNTNEYLDYQEQTLLEMLEYMLLMHEYDDLQSKPPKPTQTPHGKGDTKC